MHGGIRSSKLPTVLDYGANIQCYHGSRAERSVEAMAPRRSRDMAKAMKKFPRYALNESVLAYQS